MLESKRNQRPVSECALCGKVAQLCIGHFTPRFVGKWLKGDAGKLRRSDEPDHVHQDLMKEPLFCEDCEEVLSALETKFAPIFRKITKGHMQLHCTDEVFRFAVSVGFRAALYGQKLLNQNGISNAGITLTAAMDKWRDYLLQLRSDAGQSEHHVLFTQDMFLNRTELPSYMRTSMLGATSMGIKYQGKVAEAIMRIPHLIFISKVGLPTKRNWHGTQLHIGSLLRVPQEVEDVKFARFLVSQSNQLYEDLGRTSDPQFRAQISDEFDPHKNFIAQESWSWVVADALAHRATPIYEDTASKCARLHPGQRLQWIMTVSGIEIESRPEGEVTLVYGTSNDSSHGELMFVLRGQYRMRVGMNMSIIHDPNFAVLGAIAFNVRDSVTGELNYQ